MVTDSTPYLPRSLVDRWAIREVSLYVGWDGDLRPEHDYADLDAFYARLRESPDSAFDLATLGGGLPRLL